VLLCLANDSLVLQGEFVDKYGILRTVTTKSLIVVTPALLVASFPATETPALLVASFPATETPALLVASFQTTQTPALLLASLQASKHLYSKCTIICKHVILYNYIQSSVLVSVV